MVGNVIVNCQLFLTFIYEFLCPQKIMKFIHGGHFEFQWNLKKTPAHLYIVGKWNESGFRPPLCTYRLNWARRTSWGWWDDWDDTVLQTQDSSPGGLRPSMLPLGHGGSPQYWLSHVDGEETFLFLSNCRDREPNPELWRERQPC